MVLILKFIVVRNSRYRMVIWFSFNQFRKWSFSFSIFDIVLANLFLISLKFNLAIFFWVFVVFITVLTVGIKKLLISWVVFFWLKTDALLIFLVQMLVKMLTLWQNIWFLIIQSKHFQEKLYMTWPDKFFKLLLGI